MTRIIIRKKQAKKIILKQDKIKNKIEPLKNKIEQK